MKKLFIPNDEVEAYAIKAFLAENLINTLVQSYHESAYGGLFQIQKGWGAIFVQESDYKSASRLLTDWLSDEPLKASSDFKLNTGNNIKKEEQVMKRRRQVFFIILALSFGMNTFFIAKYFHKRTTAFHGFDFFDTEGYLTYRVDWKENRYYPARTTEYLRSGKASCLLIDSDDDGRIDEYTDLFFNSNTTFFDKDSDGVFEKSIINYKNGSVVKKVDSDQNRVFESAIINMISGEIYKLQYSNNNGYILSILTHEGEELSLDILREISCGLEKGSTHYRGQIKSSPTSTSPATSSAPTFGGKASTTSSP